MFIKDWKEDIGCNCKKDSNVVNPLLCAGWRDCSEELPDTSGFYLLYRKGYVTKIDYFIKGGQFNDDKFTHWMPEPDPPTGI